MNTNEILLVCEMAITILTTFVVFLTAGLLRECQEG